MSNIYFDHNATTPPAPEVVKAVTNCMSQVWANASSQHSPGQVAKQRLGQSRATVSRFLNCKPSELVFTSCATEANHMAIHGALARSGRRRLLISAVEHAGLHKLAQQLPDVQVDWMPVHANGELNFEAARALMRDDLALVSLMAANNETGVLMPIAEMAELAHAHGTLLHVDATQWIGKLPFDFRASGADLVSVSAHKFNGPKGVGALIVRHGLAWPAWMVGSQERGRRGGTENLPAIAGFAAAAELHMAGTPLNERAAHTARLRDLLEQGLLSALPGTVVYGAGAPRLPNTICLRFGLLPAELVLQRFERLGVIASSGSACASAGSEPSHVLTAMGAARDEALCAVRLSLDASTTEAQVRRVLEALPPELGPLMHEMSEVAELA